MTLYASLSGARVTSATLTLPGWGLWSADVELATDAPIPSACALTIANLTLVGHVHRTAAFAGNRSARVVGGAGGWRRTVGARDYGFPGVGVPLSMVLGDLAAEVGERLAPFADGVTGEHFVRETAPASRVLRQLVGIEWWVDAVGVTHIGARPTVPVRSDYLVERRAGAMGRFTVATEDVAAWQPGAVFANALVTDVQTVASATVAMGEGGRLRIEVMAA